MQIREEKMEINNISFGPDTSISENTVYTDNRIGNNPINDDYVLHKEMLKRGADPTSDEYERYKDMMEKSNDPLDDDYVKEGY